MMLGRDASVFRVTRVGALSIALLMVGLSGCRERGPVSLAAGRVRFVISANVLAAGERLDVAVYYLRSGGVARVPIVEKEFVLTGTGVQQLPLVLDVTACLADPQRSLAPADECAVVADLVLRDDTGGQLDSTTVGPVNVGSASTAQAPSATLQAPAAMSVVSGDQQLGWMGKELLTNVVVRLLDRASNPMVGRALTVTPVSGGGSLVSVTPTDTGGRAVIRYTLGSTPGAQQFRVAIAQLTGVNAVVNVVAVRPQVNTISVGQFTACSTAPLGTRCWGDNSAGVVGNPAVPADTALPVPVSGGPFVAIDVNMSSNLDYHACALNANGAPWCWGVNSNGELGVPVTGTCVTFGSQVTCSRTPQPVPTSVRFATISAEGNGGPTRIETRTCGASVSGAAYCWGFGPRGELGLGGQTLVATVPTLVDSTRRWLHVAAGGRSTCGLTNQGEVYCWGDNVSGQLGNGTLGASLIPVRVNSAERFVAVDVGFVSACAVNVQGAVYCWGRDWRLSTFVLVPTPVAGVPPMARISVAAFQALGVTASGELWCWGRNLDSCGTGHYPSGSGPSPTRVPLSVPVLEPAAGANNSCARTSAGDVYCWGALASLTGAGVRGLFIGASGIYTPVKVNYSGTPAGAAAAIVPNGATSGPQTAAASSLGALPAPNEYTPLARIVDANGLPVGGVTATGNITAGGGQLFDGSTPLTSIPFTSGADGALVLPMAFRWKTGAVPGINTIRISSPGIGSLDFSVTTALAGPGSIIVPASTQLPNDVPFSISFGLTTLFAGSPGAVEVRARDASGLPVRNTAVTMRPITNGVTLAGAVTVSTDEEGIARFMAASDTVIRVNTLPGVFAPRIDTVEFQLGTTGPSARYSVLSSGTTTIALGFSVQPSQARAGTVISPAVEVAKLDRYGNRATGSGTVQLQLVGAGGTLGGPTAFNVLDARVTVVRFTNLTVSLPGTYQLRAIWSGNNSQVLSAPFQVVP